MQQNQYLLEEKPHKLLLRFAIPCILSLVISALYNIVDQIFIGNSNIGTIGNTATSIVYPLICIALAFGLLLGDGTAAYMSLCMGRKENEKISKTVGTSITVAIVICVVFLAVCFPLLNPILSLLGAKTDAALTASHEYAVWILIGMPFFIFLNVLNPIVRADGAPKIAMLSTMSGCILNIILDAIFIFPLNMGLTGAALATTIGIIVSFLISFIYLFKSKTFRLKFIDLKPNFKILWQNCKLGFSSFLTQISIVIITITSMNMLAKYGLQSKYGANDPQAIIGVIMKVFSIFVNIAVGIAAGAQPIIGCNYGAKKYSRVRKVFKYVIISTVCVGIVATLLFQIIPVPIIKIFGSNSANPELYLEFGEKALRIYLMFIIFTLIQKACSIFLQSIDNPVKATLLSLIRDVIAFVPFTVLLPISMGLDGVLWAAPIADVFGLIFSIIFVVLAFVKMKKDE
ncbi:MAG: MATE family efflux transporter [Candidatus Coproplasma sp.]